MRVGRKRTGNFDCPPGVRPIAGRWYWQPTSKAERLERKAKGLKASVPLGKAGSKAAREKWAEVSGFNDPQGEDGTVGELLRLWKRDGIKKRPNGVPRADSTVEMYAASIPVLEERFGACRYGKTAMEASRGHAIGTAEIQRFVAEHEYPTMANRHFAVLDNAFEHAIRVGRTTYNPCRDVVKNEGGVREREPLPWEVECLRAMAPPLMGLQMDFEAITGWRIGDIRKLLRSCLTADGVRVRQKKRGKRQLWEWTPELRRIVEEAAALPGATPFPASPVFPSRRGKEQGKAGFASAWSRLLKRTNAALAQCEIPLTIADLHFHDLRSKAHDDAEEAGREGHELLGNTRGVSRRHYSRREQKVRPLR